MSSKQRSPCLHLFNIRCTLLAFHALMWSFIYESKPEYKVSSLRHMSEATLDKHLDAIVITGSVCLAIYAVLTLIGFSVQSIATHFIMNILHSIGILLVIISILNYWDVKLLWIPTIICCALPMIYEIVFMILKFVSDR